MEIPEYKTPLPKGANKKAVKLSEEVNKWANLECALLLQVDDLEMLIRELGDDDRRVATLKAILKEKVFALRKAETEYDIALHKMCKEL